MDVRAPTHPVMRRGEEAGARGRRPWDLLPQGLLAPCSYLPGMGRRCRQKPRPDPAGKSGPCPGSSEVSSWPGAGSPAFRGHRSPSLLPVALGRQWQPPPVSGCHLVSLARRARQAATPRTGSQHLRRPAGRHPKTAWVLGHPPPGDGPHPTAYAPRGSRPPKGGRWALPSSRRGSQAQSGARARSGGPGAPRVWRRSSLTGGMGWPRRQVAWRRRRTSVPHSSVQPACSASAARPRARETRQCRGLDRRAKPQV